MKTRIMAATAVATVAFTISAVLFIYMAAARGQTRWWAAAIATSVCAVLGVICLATSSRKERA